MQLFTCVHSRGLCLQYRSGLISWDVEETIHCALLDEPLFAAGGGARHSMSPISTLAWHQLGLRKCCSRFSIEHATMQIDWELRLPGILRGKIYGKYLPQAGPTQHWSLWNQGHHQPNGNKVKAPCIHAHKSHIPRVPSQAGELQPSVHSFAIFDALPSIPPSVFILVFRTCENLITVSCTWICSWVPVHVLTSRHLWHTAHSMFAKAVASLLGGSLFHFEVFWGFFLVCHGFI